MVLFNYNRNIPDAPNNPSADQPLMKINTNSTDDLIDVDHFSFGENDGGYHRVIHQSEAPGNADPVAIAGIGQTYVKTVNGDQSLFFESGNGVVTTIASGSGGGGGGGFTSGTGSILLTTSYQTIFTVTADCIGFVMFSTQLLIPYSVTLGFFSIGGTLYFQQPVEPIGSQITINIASDAPGNPLDIRVNRSTGSGYTSNYKYIFWNT